MVINLKINQLFVSIFVEYFFFSSCHEKFFSGKSESSKSKMASADKVSMDEDEAVSLEPVETSPEPVKTSSEPEIDDSELILQEANLSQIRNSVNLNKIK